MRLLPYRQFLIETPLTPEDVRARLHDATEKPRIFSTERPARPLAGTIDGMSFNVMRNVTGRNSFRPCIRGTIEPAGSGSRLTGTMRLHWLVVAFVAVWVLGAGAVFVWAATHSIANRRLEPATFPALGVLVFLIFLTLGAFAVEVRRAFNELQRLVDVSR